MAFGDGLGDRAIIVTDAIEVTPAIATTSSNTKQIATYSYLHYTFFCDIAQSAVCGQSRRHEHRDATAI